MNKLIRSALNNNFSFFMAVPAIIWQVLFLYIPIVLVIGASFVAVTQAPWWQSLTISHYTHFFDSLYLIVIFRSIVLALITACACLLCAYPLAYYLAVKVIRFKNLLLFLLVLPFFTSLMVQVYAWYFVLGRDGLINSALKRVGLIQEPFHLLYNFVAVYLVMVYCYLPFMILPLYSTLEKFDRKLLESSADLGASQWQTFLKITLPLSLPGIKTGFFLVFVPAFGEFVVPTLMGGGKTLFVGTLITQYFLSVRNPFLGAAFTCLAGIGLISTVAALYYLFTYLTRDREATL